MDTLNNFDNVLKESMISFLNYGIFFTPWFKNNGKAYYFTFKSNLSKTNIQYGELKSLIISNLEDKRNLYKLQNDDIQIFNVQDFNKSIELILSSYNFPVNEYRSILKDNKAIDNCKRFEELSDVAEETINSIITNYKELLYRTIIIDPFYNSCALYLPLNLDVDIFKVISNSGYINTCGDLIYVRNFKKTKSKVFFDNLRLKIAELNKESDNSKLINFNVFSHEDFCDKIGINCDLTHLKIHLDKYYFDGRPLMSVLYDLKDEFRKDLHINIVSIPENNTINRYSIWLVKESCIAKNLKYPGDNNYYICYLQRYKNENQLHIFNENKPAWKSNTNIPHDLISAMINIALEGRDKEKEIKIIDPFLGSGTTFIELVKYKNIYHNLKIFGSDIELSTELLLKDNLTIMSMDVSELDELLLKLKNKNIYREMLAKKEELSLFYKDNQSEFEIDENNYQLLKDIDIEERLLFYTYFKVRITRSIDIKRKGDFRNYFKIELEKLIEGIINLRDTLLPYYHEESYVKNGFKVVDGHFSSKISIDPIVYKNQIKEINEVNYNQLIIDNFENLGNKKYDIIICDPPYGFNANNNLFNLIELYRKLPSILISLLKDNGQIIMSLPDESYSGKHSPWFTHKEMVIAKFHFASHELGRKMFNYSEINPRKDLFNAPYYWEAQRALRRSIINLKFS